MNIDLRIQSSNDILSCINLVSSNTTDLLKVIRIKKTIGKGTYGDIYHVTDMSEKYNFCLKRVLKRNSKEIFILNILKNIVENKVCPNFPYLISYYECSDSSYLFNIKLYTSPCNIIITEIAQGTLDYWLYNNKPSEEELNSCLFQIMAGIHMLQKLQISNNDIKSNNILFFNVPKGGFWHYVILGIDFYVPNYGKLFIINDYGVSLSFNPDYPVSNTPFFNLGNRSIFVDTIDKKFLSIESCKNYDVVTGKLCEKNNYNKSIMNISNNKIQSYQPIFNDRQFFLLNHYNIPIQSDTINFYKRKEIPPIQIFNDMIDTIRIFIGGKRTTQQSNHNIYNIDPQFISQLRKYNFTSMDDTHIFEKTLADYFILDFFKNKYDKNNLQTNIIESYYIS